MADSHPSNARDYRRLMQEALVELDSLQQQLDTLRRARSEPIAVVGMACRLPGGANSPSQFWELLRDGVDAVTEIPAERWSLDRFFATDAEEAGHVYSRHAALVDQWAVEQFDPAFFGIAPREAERMDPQQRMLLEICWEALEDAAVAADEAKGSRTGLFVGSCTDDYLHLSNNLVDPDSIDAYTSLGTARCITVGRVSYMLGLEGPAVQLDTACSSSLVALHQACQSLRTGDCDMALAGGVNLQLTPVWTLGLCKLKAISPDGRCRTFDASGNGFVRGEGCAIVALKRLSDAQNDGDRILALLRGSAVNHDGRSSGLTVPSQTAQEKLLQQALDNAQLRSAEIDFIEAHGTGTVLGDPVEMGALASVYGPRERPLWVGSVKTNIGHLEGAAGIAGLLKVILAMNHEHIPRNLHFENPNPHIPWHEFAARVPTETLAWRRSNRPRIAGVSSFGFSGTNAHVLVEEPPVNDPSAANHPPGNVLVVSAQTSAGLRALAGRYAERLANSTATECADICHTAWVGRSHFEQRLAVVAPDAEGLRRGLMSFRDGERIENVYVSDAVENIQAVPHDDGSAHGSLNDAFDAMLNEERGERQYGQNAKQIVERFVAGADVDRQRASRAFEGRKVSLPTYPFQRSRYWRQSEMVTRPAARTGDEPTLHELLGRRLHSAAATDLTQYEAVLSERDPRYLADHRVGKRAVTPGAALLEIALAAARDIERREAVAVVEVAFHRPLTFAERESRIVQTALQPSQNGNRWRIFSRAADSHEIQSPLWVLHASGGVAPASMIGEQVVADLEAARAECPEPASRDDVYQRIARQGLTCGQSFRLLRDVWRGTGRALGRVELTPDLPGGNGEYCLHPAMLDGCLQVIGAISETETAGLIVPARVQRFDVFGCFGREVYSYVRLRERGGDGPGTYFAFDIDLLDGSGELVARMRGLRMQQTERLQNDESVRHSPTIATMASEAPRETAFVAELLETPAGNRMRLLIRHVQGQLATVLGWQSHDKVEPQKNLADLGVNSITAVELQSYLEKSLGVNLPLTLAFDYPNVELLAGYIAQQLGVPTDEMTPRKSDAMEDQEHVKRVAAMSEDEIQSILTDKLKDLL